MPDMLITIGIGIVVVWFYVLFAREWLEVKLAGTPYEWWHQKVEDVLWAKSRTILIARGYQLVGWLVALQALAASAGVDVTPVTNALADFIPAQYRPLAVGLFLVVTGLIFAKLRKISPGYREEA